MVNWLIDLLGVTPTTSTEELLIVISGYVATILVVKTVDILCDCFGSLINKR